MRKMKSVRYGEELYMMIMTRDGKTKTNQDYPSRRRAFPGILHTMEI